jgi:hypothetical protein
MTPLRFPDDSGWSGGVKLHYRQATFLLCGSTPLSGVLPTIISSCWTPMFRLITLGWTDAMVSGGSLI